MTATSERDSGPGFPIVGIGASAGGLAAFDAFFSGLPTEGRPGMALVLLQHLAPDHESHLAELVRRQTPLEVVELADGMEVEKDHVYVIPPGKGMVLEGGRIRLLDPTEPRGHRLPIDGFFTSLAHELGERAICVVLSGSGSDGTQGVRAVKEAGGLVLVQDPDSTEYGEMPRSALATGMVDHVLPAGEMLSLLIDPAARGARGPSMGSSAPPSSETGTSGVPVGDETESGPPPTPSGETEALGRIFDLLQEQTGRDFSHYKQKSVRRRIDRRMALQQLELLEEYSRYLEGTPEEVDRLFNDLLIGVTRFFRDPEAFRALEEKAIPRLIEGRAPEESMRIWVPGCSTGEEAYSIAILFRERMDAAGLSSKLEIFATDIDPAAIAIARAGIYLEEIRENVTAERLERFFTHQEEAKSYRVRKSLRDLLVFSEQDLITDPPFSRMALVSCRNVLIYMDAELQNRLIPLFRYSLDPDGILFLGTSESVGQHEGLFKVVDRSAKLYQRNEELSARAGQAPGPFLTNRTRGAGTPAARSRASTTSPARRLPSPGELMERELLHHHAPAAVLVDAEGEILYLHGRTGEYLEPAPGDGRMNVLEMAREGLRRDLAVALHQATTRKGVVERADLRIEAKSSPVIVDLSVHPMENPGGDDSEAKLFLVVMDDCRRIVDFDDRESSTGARVPDGDDGASGSEAEADPRVIELEGELQAKEDYLQAMQEEMQTSNEELKSANEELQTTNEELQSANEELATSKEELQSVNEELATINAELEAKVADLSRAENDMKNLLAGTGIGTLFVDHELRIQRFTPSAVEILNLIPGVVGRPVGDLTSRLPTHDRLSDDIEAVLETLVPSAEEVQTKAGDWYLLQIRPYRTLENVIQGAVITFTDITEVKAARATLREAEVHRRLAVVVEDANDAVTMQELDGCIRAWNPAAVRIYGWSQDEALNMNYVDLAPEETKNETRAMLARLRLGDAPAPFRTRRRTKDDRILTVWVTATPLVDESGSTYALATTERIVEPDLDRPGGRVNA